MSTLPSEKDEFKHNHPIKEINAEKRKTKTRVRRSIVKALKDREREFGPPGEFDHEPDIEEVMNCILHYEHDWLSEYEFWCTSCNYIEQQEGDQFYGELDFGFPMDMDKGRITIEFPKKY